MVEDSKPLIEVSYFINPDEVIKMAEAKGYSLDQEKLNIAKAVSYLGLQRVIESIGKKSKQRLNSLP